MRVVADTNTIISGLLWKGAPRSVLDAAHQGTFDLFTSAILLAELEDVLNREKFTKRLEAAGLKPRDLVLGYAALANLVESANIPSLLEDPDDEAVLACAVAANAEIIVSGDSHLLNLRKYQNISILTATELLVSISKQK